MKIKYFHSSQDLYDELDLDLNSGRNGYHYYEKKIKSEIEGKEYSAFFIMPNKGRTMEELITALSSNDSDVSKQLSMSSYTNKNSKVKEIGSGSVIRIPIFEAYKRNDIKEILIREGVTDMFEKDKNTLKSLFVDSKKSNVGDIRQTIHFQINEEGVIIGGTEPDLVQARGGCGGAIYVTFDNPFVYGLKANRVVRFIGSFYGDEKDFYV